MAQSHVRRHLAFFSVAIALWFIGIGTLSHEKRVEHVARTEVAHRAVIAMQVLETLHVDSVAVAVGRFAEISATPSILTAAVGPSQSQQNNVSTPLSVTYDGDGIRATAVTPPLKVSVTSLNAAPQHRSCRLMLGTWGVVFAGAATASFLALGTAANALSRRRRALGVVALIGASLTPLLFAGVGIRVIADAEGECLLWARASSMRDTLQFALDISAAAGAAGAPVEERVAAITACESSFGPRYTLSSVPNAALLKHTTYELEPAVSARGGADDERLVAVRGFDHEAGAQLVYAVRVAAADVPHGATADTLTLVLVGIAISIVVCLSLFPFPKMGSVRVDSPLDQLPRSFGSAKLIHAALALAALIAACVVLVVDTRSSHFALVELSDAHEALKAAHERELVAATKRLSVVQGLATGSDWDAEALDYSDFPEVDAVALATLSTFYDEAKTVRSRVDETTSLMPTAQRQAALAFSLSSSPRVAAELRDIAAVNSTRASSIAWRLSLMQAICRGLAAHSNSTLVEPELAALRSKVEMERQAAAAAGVATGEIAGAISSFAAQCDAILSAAKKRLSTGGGSGVSFADARDFYGTTAARDILALEEQIQKNISDGSAAAAARVRAASNRRDPIGLTQFVIAEAAVACFVALSLVAFFFVVDSGATIVLYAPDPLYASRREQVEMRASVDRLWESWKTIIAMTGLVVILALIAVLVARQQSLADISTQQRRFSTGNELLRSTSTVRLATLSSSTALTAVAIAALTEQSPLQAASAAKFNVAASHVRNAIESPSFPGVNRTLVSVVLRRNQDVASTLAKLNSAVAARIAASAASDFTTTEAAIASAAALGANSVRAVADCDTAVARELAVACDSAFAALLSNTSAAPAEFDTALKAIETVRCPPATNDTLDALLTAMRRAGAAIAAARRLPDFTAIVANISQLASEMREVEALQKTLLNAAARVVSIEPTNAMLATFWAPTLLCWAATPLLWKLSSVTHRMVGVARHAY